MRIGTVTVLLVLLLPATGQANVVLSGYIGFLVSGSDESSSASAIDGTAQDAVEGSLDAPDDALTDTETEEEPDADDGPRSPGSPTFSSDVTSLNIAALHSIGYGLTAYGNYSLDGALSGSSASVENVWIGVRGRFGDVRIGEVPDASQFGQLTGDTLPSSFVGGEDAGISYRGFFGPLNVGANFSPVNNTDRRAIGARLTYRGLAIGAGVAQQGSREGNTIEATAGLSFAHLGISYALSAKDFDNGRHTAGARVGYAISGISLTVSYEQEVGTNDLAGDQALRLDIGYFLNGGVLISGRVNQFLDDSNPENDLLSYRLQVGKTF